jgi:bifunctional UDP-N-acetylglucosamine pyrophosphorylase/glucosamine-1-phosphate N-acetyltransferase
MAMTQVRPTQSRRLYVVIPAAGRGSRMRSDVPKVLQIVGDEPMIKHVTKKARLFLPEKIIVVEPADNALSSAVDEEDVIFVTQSIPNGVATAILEALPQISEPADILILLGDSPLIDTKAVQSTVQKHQTEDNALTLLIGLSVEDYPYSRLVRAVDGGISALTLTSGVPGVKEYSLGPLIASSELLRKFLPQVGPISDEFRLEGLVEMLVKAGLEVGTYAVSFEPNRWGINDKRDLAKARHLIRKLHQDPGSGRKQF